MSLDSLYFHKALGYRFIGHHSLAFNPSFYKDEAECNANISECHLCPLCKIRQSSILISAGANKLENKADNVSSKASQSSALFVSLLAYPGIERDIAMFKGLLAPKLINAHFAFLLKCAPSAKGFENFNKNANIDFSIAQCKAYFDMELKALSPRVIIALGAKVFRTLMGQSECAYTSLRGGLYRLGDGLIMPTHDLALLAKNPSLKCEVIADLHKLKALL